MTSKRRYHRVRAKGVSVHVETGAGIATYPIENLSMGGLFLRTTEEEFPAGSRLLFTLVKPGLKRGLQLGAVVAFVREGRGVGLRFDELGSSDREKLQQILRELGVASPDAPDAGESPVSDWGDAVSMSAPAPSADYGKEPPTEPNIKVAKILAQGPSPAKSTLFDDFKSSPPREKVSEPIPFGSAHAGFRPPPAPAPAAQPQGPVALPAPSSDEAPAAAEPPAVNLDPQERLMLQIRGLLLQLGETQEQLVARENEIVSLKEEIQRLTEELQKKDGERARHR